MINPSTPARINFDQFNFRVTYSIENDSTNTQKSKKLFKIGLQLINLIV